MPLHLESVYTPEEALSRHDYEGLVAFATDALGDM